MVESLSSGVTPGPHTKRADPPPQEPRDEIRFRRRVGVVAASAELWRYRELVLTLAERDLRVRYKQSVLGVAWALMTPLLLIGAFSLIFNRVTDVADNGVPYPLFVAVGLVPWTFFSSAFSRGGLSLVSNIPLLNKLYCPREVFPLSSIALASVDAVAAGFVVALLFPITGYSPQLESFYAPLLIAIALCFTVGVTLTVSSVVVYLRDVQVVLPLIVQFGLFVTPVGYSADSLVNSQAGLAVLGFFNPLAPVIDGLRGGVLMGEAPDLVPTLAGAAGALIALVTGFVLFKRMEAGIADIA